MKQRMYTPLNAQWCSIFTIQSDRVPIRSHKAAQLLDKIPSITLTPSLHYSRSLHIHTHTIPAGNSAQSMGLQPSIRKLHNPLHPLSSVLIRPCSLGSCWALYSKKQLVVTLATSTTKAICSELRLSIWRTSEGKPEKYFFHKIWSSIKKNISEKSIMFLYNDQWSPSPKDILLKQRLSLYTTMVAS